MVTTVGCIVLAYLVGKDLAKLYRVEGEERGTIIGAMILAPMILALYSMAFSLSLWLVCGRDVPWPIDFVVARFLDEKAITLLVIAVLVNAIAKGPLF